MVDCIWLRFWGFMFTTILGAHWCTALLCWHLENLIANGCCFKIKLPQFFIQNKDRWLYGSARRADSKWFTWSFDTRIESGIFHLVWNDIFLYRLMWGSWPAILAAEADSIVWLAKWITILVRSETKDDKGSMAGDVECWTYFDHSPSNGCFSNTPLYVLPSLWSFAIIAVSKDKRKLWIFMLNHLKPKNQEPEMKVARKTASTFCLSQAFVSYSRRLGLLEDIVKNWSNIWNKADSWQGPDHQNKSKWYMNIYIWNKYDFVDSQAEILNKNQDSECTLMERLGCIRSAAKVAAWLDGEPPWTTGRSPFLTGQSLWFYVFSSVFHGNNYNPR